MKQILFYMNTDSFIIFIKTEDIYIDVSKGVETRFNTWNYELDHYLEEKIKKSLG